MASSDSPSGGDGGRDVFGSLPSTRPQRRSSKRDGAGGTAKAAPAAAKAKTPAAKPQAKPPAARTKAKPKPRPAGAAEPSAAPTAPIPPAGYATPRADDHGVPRGGALVTTAVQAAGELAQIGLHAGGRALKSALERLPRP